MSLPENITDTEIKYTK